MKSSFSFICFTMLFLCCFSAHAQYIVSTVAGNGFGAGGASGGFSGDGGQATNAMLSMPSGVAMDGAGNIYIADRLNLRVRRVTPAGIISTVAGNGTLGFSGDGGPATTAQLGGVRDVAIDAAGNIYTGDESNCRVRKVNTAGIITTAAGNGTIGFSGDGGPATVAQVSSSVGVFVTTTGTLYLADRGNHCIRRVDAAGIITTIAGTGGVAGFAGDGGPATAALMDDPVDLCIDPTGNIYVADLDNRRIRKIDPSGIITTIAGTGSPFTTGDGGPAIAAGLSQPGGIAADAAGNVFLIDWSAHILRKIDAAGIITTIAGTPFVVGYNGDGCAPMATQFNRPGFITVVNANDIYLSDRLNHRIRRIHLNDTPSFAAGISATLHVCRNDTPVSLGSVLAVHDSDNRQPITWSALTPPVHGSLTTSFTDTTNGGIISPSGMWYTPSPGYTGPDSFRVRVEDCAQAADTITIYVTVHLPPPVGSITGATVICTGTAITLSCTPPGGTWSSPHSTVTVGASSGIVSGSTPGTAIISYTIPGTYCSATATTAVTVATLPVAATLSGLTTLCSGVSSTLSASVPGGVWSSTHTTIATISGTGVLTAIAVGTTTISYTITNACGTVVTTVSAVVNPLPVAGTISGGNAACPGQALLLSASVPGGVWLSSHPAIASITAGGLVTGIIAGTTTISYSISNSCGTATATATVTIGALTWPITGSTSLCVADTTTLANTATGGTWSSSNTAIATVGTATGTVQGIAPGTATITYSLGSSCETVVIVTVHPVPDAGTLSGSAAICVGSAVTLASSVTGGSWGGSNAQFSVSGTGMVTGIAAGTGTVTYTVSGAGCSATATTVVTVHPLPYAGVITGPALLCAGAEATLRNTATGGTWSSSNTTTATITNTGYITTSTTTGTTTITYTVGPDANGCTNLSTFLLTVIIRPFTAGGSIAPITCYGTQNATITATPTGAPYIYQWSTGSTAPAIAALTPGSYTVSVTDTTNRCSDTTTFVITQPDSLIASYTTTPDICSTATGSITISISGGTTPYSYLWAHSNTTTPNLSALSAGSYTLTLSDANGCTLLLNTTIIDSACTGIVINTGISPNGDGINDTWIIEGLFPYPMNTVQVFDKWGDIVYDRTHYQNDWNGTGKNGTLLPDGTYCYLLKLNDEHKTGGENVFKGTVMIKR